MEEPTQGASSNTATHSPAASLAPPSFPWVPRVLWAPWPACVGTVLYWTADPSLSGVRSRSGCIPTPHPSERGHSAKAGLNVKLKVSALVSEGLAPPQVTRGIWTPATTGVERGSPGTCSVKQRQHRPRPVQVVGEGKRDRMASASTHYTLFPSQELIPIWDQQGGGVYGHTGRNAKRGMGCVCEEPTPSLPPSLGVAPQPDPWPSVTITASLSKFPVKLRLGHNSWHQMLHRK